MATKIEIMAELESLGMSKADVEALSYNEMRKKLKELKASTPVKEEAPAPVAKKYIAADLLLQEKIKAGYTVKLISEKRTRTVSKYERGKFLAWMSNHNATEMVFFGKSGERAVQVKI